MADDSPKTCPECKAPMTESIAGVLCPACLLDRGWMTEEKSPAADLIALPPAFGDYELIAEIARGGMGVVYKARQKSLSRIVAVKMVLAGKLAKQSELQRFRAEAETAARLQHPNIVAIHEVGEFEGQPFFSMDYVEGKSLAELAHNEPISAKRAASYLKTIAEAVEYAHSKGVLHRDLKPSNILIDQDDQPRITDFGLAKRLDHSALSILNSSLTITGQVLGSPNFMPPEQASGDRKAVGPASDVYSLGAILYQLVTGRPPFGAETLAQTLRLVAESEPVAPRLLNPSVPRDLETVCLKCLQKEPARRYSSAAELGDELTRVLRDEPIQARPATPVDRLLRWSRRNRALAGALATTALLLLVVTIGSPIAALRINRARQNEVAMRKQAEANGAKAMAAEKRAEGAAAKQEAINRFLNDMLASADPYALSAQDRAKGPKVTMLEVVDAAARQVNAGSLKDKPAIEAAICQTLGETYTSLDQGAAAEPLLRKALELNRQIYGEMSDPAIGSQRALARVRLAERVKMMREVLAMERRLHGNDHPHVANSLIELADHQSWDARGRYNNASELIVGVEDNYREGLALQRKLLPSDSPELIGTLVSMASFLFDYTDKHDEAEKLVREALPIQLAAHGKRHPMTATLLLQLSRARLKVQDYGEAQRFCEEAVSIQREVFNTNHLELATGLGWLGEVLRQANKLVDSEAALREGLEIQRRTRPGSHDMAWALRKLAEILVQQKRFADAEVLYREAVKFWEEKSTKTAGGEAYQFHFAALLNVLKSQNKLAEVEALYHETLQYQRKTVGETNVAVPATLCALGDVLLSRGATNQAEEAYQQAVDLIPKLQSAGYRDSLQNLVASLRSKVSPSTLAGLFERLLEVEARNPDSPNFHQLALLQDYGDLLATQNRCEEAAVQYLKALPIRRSQKDGGLLAWTLRNLGGALLNCSRVKEAEQYLRESINVYRASHKTDDLWGTAAPLSGLGDVLYCEGKLSEARQAFEEALTSYTNCNAIDEFGFVGAVHGVVELLMAEGKFTEAHSVLERVLADERRAFGEKDVRTATTLLALAQFFKRDSKPQQAAKCCREAEDVIVNSPPEDLLHLPSLAIAAMMDLGLSEQARNACNRVLVAAGSNAPSGLNKAYWLDGASWALLSDPCLALELAQNAAGLAPEHCCYPLGIALYRCGDWHRAVAELTKAAPRDQGNIHITRLLYLAMAHHCLGETEASRKYHSEAANWMSANTPCDRGLLGLRAEADELLGAKESPLTHTSLSH